MRAAALDRFSTERSDTHTASKTINNITNMSPAKMNQVIVESSGYSVSCSVASSGIRVETDAQHLQIGNHRIDLHQSLELTGRGIDRSVVVWVAETL